ncbi:GNAT family N-acetyltransferase [Luteolibacter arcticus]|uniref:GNAT family N-acetyltransferase n=1 Tax=Luteolibacter arcticus TaxID=1581411 RepID=A0ABT3GH31_9BACT|nr:GNAT family N-acetyltransferase [Luteolibacter arcticus]MCW1922912.1 GNAT family N-acetyltransferase [Luteolibacter arcticus]
MALHEEGVALHFSKIVTPKSRGLAPYYHFRILAGSRDVGHINLRVGDSEHVHRVVGHVGYGIRKRHRGHRYALLACRALAPFARTVTPEVILTCDPANHASRHTLERLVGGESGEEVSVPRRDPHYRRGARTKLRFRWVP